MKRVVVILACALLAGCATPVPMTSPVGVWQGTGIPGHQEARYVRRFFADGTTQVSYCFRHGRDLHIEHGHWTMQDGGALTLSTDESDGKAVGTQDSYTTSSFDGDTWTITLAASAATPDEVDNDFDLLRTNDAMQLTAC